jgi:adenylate cyclase
VAPRQILRRLRRPIAATALGLVVGGALVAAREVGVLEPFELDFYDRFQRLAHPGTGVADPRIVIVTIREKDIRRFGHPLSDELLARALGVLLEHGARAVGVDLYRDSPVAPGSSDLERVVVRNPTVVMTERMGDRDIDTVPPPPYVMGTGQVGFSDVVLDPDGHVRRGLLLMNREGRSGYSLSSRLAMRYLAFEGVLPGWSRSGGLELKLGETRLPRFGSSDGGYVGADPGGYQLLLAYPRGRPTFQSLTLSQLLDGSGGLAAIRGRVALVGTSAASVPDRHVTPFGPIDGVEHHAQLVSELLDRALEGAGGMRFPNDDRESLAIVGSALLASLLGATLRSPLALGLAALGGLAVIVGGSFQAFRAGWWLPVLPASLAWMAAGGLSTAYAAFVEAGERRRVMELFGRFLAPDVAAEVWRERDAFLDGGRPRSREATITVMMTDLVGYTEASEKLGPPALTEWINEYLDVMSRLIGAHGGVVNDYYGDGIMANFGVPVPRTTEPEIDADAVAAVECALAMEAALARLNGSWRSRGLPEAQMRVGLHTGRAVVGLVGSAQRLKFTSLGDVVNTAERIEHLRREEFRGESSIVRILVSDDTYRRLGGAYAAEELGEVELRGKLQRVTVHRIRANIMRERRET